MDENSAKTLIENEVVDDEGWENVDEDDEELGEFCTCFDGLGNLFGYLTP